MNPSESFKVAFVNLKSNKLRSFLSMLGIVIGTATVIVVVSVTNGAKQQTLESIGNTNSYVFALTPKYNEKMNRQLELKPEDAQLFQGLPFVKSVLPRIYKTFDVRTTKKMLRAPIVMIDPHYVKLYRMMLLAGRNVNDFDMVQRGRVCLIGRNLAKLLFDAERPVGETLYFQQVPFEVIGVVRSPADDILAAETAGSPSDEETGLNELFIPYTTALRMDSEVRVDGIDIHVDKDYAGPTLKELYAAMEKADKREDDYLIQDPREILAQIEKQSAMFSAFLGMIASISLIVGGVGIMNVMLTSVAERTREIGIRKAIGASQKDILAQFIIEACVICSLGGAAGIFSGMAVSWLMPWLSGQKIASVILYSSVFIAFFFSLAVGLLFGTYPAIKASRLSPAEALRIE